ncbi:MAG TPA: hypothetical protein VNL18_12605 [Gemmatimonadales bacterium]|nr:hypothetical protein [Gemmatimonadales bacterium]
MGSKKRDDRAVERRKRPRTSSDHIATGLVQAMVRDPASAASMITRDLSEGADPDVVLGVLDAVEAILRLRGVDRSEHLKALRRSVERRRW